MKRLFQETTAPRVFALPPGADFASELARGLKTRLADAPPDQLARVQIVMNTRRAARTLADAFAGQSAAGFLPRIDLIDGLAAGEGDGPPPVPRLTRRLVLAKLVAAMLRAWPRMSDAAAGRMAKSLAGLLDETARDRAPLAALEARLRTDAEGLAAHWRETLDALKVVAETWPDVCRDDLGGLDPGDRRVRDVDALLAKWEDAPPDRPIIAAGSTGSQRLTADMLTAIARLPQGAIVLPGFAFEMDDAAWGAAGPDHPQYGFKRLLERLDIPPEAVRRWTDAPDGPRAALLTEALRPAPVSDRWRDALPALGDGIDAATAGLTLIDAPTPRREAEAVAIVMRDALEAGESVALITPDRSLARRVAGALSRWGVEPDDSSGRPLRLTPPGVFLSMLAAVLTRPFDPAALLALLKHPLTTGADREALRAGVSRLETKGLRRRDAARGLASIEDCFAAKARERRGDESTGPLVDDALRPILEALRPWGADAAPLADLVDAFRRAAEALSPTDLWDKAAGREADAALARFAEAAGPFGLADPADFAEHLAAALEEGGDVREDPWRADPRLRILGPLEARAQAFDVMVLSGLNEGGWPQTPEVDPWLSRPMRIAAGLNPPERRIGLSAHDFLQAASARRAVMTRATKVDGAPTTPSRWLSRLTTLMSGVVDGAALEAARARGRGALAAAESLTPAPVAQTSAREVVRPAPRPPAAARPRRLSVTEIATLIRDPYAIYGRRVLRLEPLEEPGAPPDMRLRGEVAHRVMERFVRETMATPFDEPAARDLFDRIADEEVAAARAPGPIALAWRARLARSRDWFLHGEAIRRAAGAPIAVEARGELVLEIGGDDFTLVGVADRIDRLADGGLAIYDYKTGAAPTQPQVALFEKQLPLLAAIAAADGFGPEAAGAATSLAYLSLSGDRKAGGKITEIAPEPDAAAGLKRLIAAWLDPDRPFIPRAYPELISYESDYDHLSRFGEWRDRPPAAGPDAGGGR